MGQEAVKLSIGGALATCANPARLGRELMETFVFQPMHVAAAQAIARWQYAPPYDFYNLDADPDDRAEFLNPANWPGTHFAVYAPDAHPGLVGFLTAVPSQTGVEIGLGLRPDMTGQGFGRAFLVACLDVVVQQSRCQSICLKVAEFNRRAIIVYERAGFRVKRRFMQPTNGSTFPFVEMELAPPAPR